jgi:hypothetical protein
MGGLVGAAFLLSRRSESAAGVSGNAVAPSPASNPFGTVAALLWLALVFGAIELWYRAHERHLVARPAWEAHWPEEHAARAVPIAETAAAILRYSDASSAAWSTADGEQWWGFFARWKPGRAALQLVRSHSPEICLPAVGRTFRGELAPVTLQTKAAPLTFRVFEFQQSSQPLFVFVSIEEDKVASAATAAPPPAEWSARGRLLAAWRGQRNLGQRLLEIAVIGLDDFARAHEALAQSINQIVQASEPTR